mmetsp:Transcript_114927/g.325997  ORF Transcript_114927/g.325997 Transcript_114927/m.325997 type:complete len:500 (+) Transcript_114927:216-1715(+)
MGFAMDCLSKEVFMFPTPKVVRVHDVKLALLRHFLLGLIFTFIVVFHIAYRGSHLNTTPVHGVVRVQLRDPSEDSCDPFHMNCSHGFESMSKLPYCQQNNFTGVYQKECEYWDSVELRQVTDEGLLIPTRVLTFMQRQRCHPSRTNDWSCNGTLYDFIGSNGEKQSENSKPRPVKDVFVADVERFDILLDHSAHSQSTTYTGDGTKAYDFEMLGIWEVCEDNSKSESENCTDVPILCVHENCPPGSALPPRDPDAPALIAARARTRASPTSEDSHEDTPYKKKGSYETMEPSDEPDLVDEFELADYWVRKNHVAATTKGDLLKLSRLIQTAGVALDNNVTHGAGETYRNDGFAIVVRIEYSNEVPWLGLQVSPWKPTGPTMFYKYHVIPHSTGDVKLRKVDYFSDEDHQQVTREVEEFRGIRIVVEQTGSIRVWDTMQLMFLVTTTLALLAVASCILDTVALGCMSRSSEYRRLKFETEVERPWYSTPRERPRATNASP